MNFRVYWQSSVLKRWKFCGGFETFYQANEHIDYLMRHLPDGSSVRFRVNGFFKNFLVMN